MTHWKRLDRQLVYRSDWLTLTVDELELPDGRVIKNFELIHFPHQAVGIVAVNDEGNILLVRAYRYFHDTHNWEVPGGVVEAAENPIDAVRRELREETGYEAGIITPTLMFYPHKATCDQKYHLYLAENLKKAVDGYDQVEISDVGFHAVDEVKKMIDDGEIDDGMSLVALQRYFLKFRK